MSALAGLSALLCDAWHHGSTVGTGEAIFSRGQRYRYALARHNGSGEGSALWIGLNPSKADAIVTDPTVTRESRRTFRWGFRTYLKANAYALVSTDPKGLERDADPEGADNDFVLCELADKANIIVLAWGGFIASGRRRNVLALLDGHADKTICLGVTRGGEPRHPLYLPNDAPTLRWPDLSPCSVADGALS